VLAFPEDAVIQRLQGVSAIALLGLAPDLKEAMETPPRNAPALFVSFGTTGSQSELSGEQIQGGRQTAVQLVLWVRNAGGPEAALRARREVKEAIDARLSGWSPDDAVDALYQLGDRDQFTHGSWLVSQLIYRANWIYSGSIEP
jgi:hypothetical protein